MFFESRFHLDEYIRLCWCFEGKVLEVWVELRPLVVDYNTLEASSIWFAAR